MYNFKKYYPRKVYLAISFKILILQKLLNRVMNIKIDCRLPVLSNVI